MKPKLSNRMCLTCGNNISHKPKAAKYCNSKCYWTSSDSILKSAQRNNAAEGWGKYNSINGVWNKGLTKETNDVLKHISDSRMGDNNPYNRAIKEGRSFVYLKGKTYLEYFGEAKADLIKNKIRNKTIKQYQTGNTRKTNTAPEKIFANILNDAYIEYTQSFYLNKKIYDFYLPTYNLLVEIDGIYWHGKDIQIENLNETQRKNVLNDAVKNNIAYTHGYNLLRIWEDELDTFNIQTLKKYE